MRQETPVRYLPKGNTHVRYQIGLSKSARRTYALDDVALAPTRRTRDRRDVDTSWQIDAFKLTPNVARRSDCCDVSSDSDCARKLGG